MVITRANRNMQWRVRDSEIVRQYKPQQSDMAAKRIKNELQIPRHIEQQADFHAGNNTKIMRALDRFKSLSPHRKNATAAAEKTGAWCSPAYSIKRRYRMVCVLN